MSFDKCIKTAVETGRLGAKKAQEALDIYEATFNEKRAEGLSEQVSDLAAAHQALEDVTELTKARQWERINELRKAHALNEKFKDTARPGKELDKVIETMELVYDRSKAFLLSGLDEFLVKYAPKLGGVVRPVDNMDNVVHASFGDVRNPAAETMAKSILEVNETVVRLLNREGASIPTNKVKSLPQAHDRLKVKRLAGGEKEYVDLHMREGILNWSTMRWYGKAVPVEKRREVLAYNYQGIMTNGDIRGAVGQRDNKSLVGRLQQDRFLHYANADAWLEMQDKFGAGNIHEQIVGMIDSAARDLATLEVLGPNPSSMLKTVERMARKRAAELQLANPSGTFTSKINSDVQRFESQYNIFNHNTVHADENIFVNATAAVRTVVANALLGNVFISSWSDIATTKWAQQFHKIPSRGVLANYFKYFLSGEVSAKQMIRSGVIFEAGINHIMGFQRYFGPMTGPAWARYMGDIVYRAQLATHHTQVIKRVNAMELMGAFADHRKMKLEKVPFAPVMQSLGITEKDWDLFSAQPLSFEGKAEFLKPIDFWRAAKGNPELEKVADKFQDFLQLVVRDGVVTSDVRSQFAMGNDIDQARLMGQVSKTLGMLKSFPATFMFRQLQSIWDMPNPRDRMAQYAKLFVFMTTAGAFITQAKAIGIRGEQAYGPEEMMSVDFLGRSIINGGSLGLFGDTVMNLFSAQGPQSLLDTPIAAYLGKAQKLTFGNVGEMIEGKEDLNADKELVDFVNANIPKLWQLRLIWDRAISDELLEQTDPGAYNRLLRKQDTLSEDGGREMWWGSDGEPQPELIFN